MKRVIYIIISILFAEIGFCQTDSISIKGNQFELKGKIINEISLTPHCGFNAFGTVIEFEIIEFSDPNYKLESIGVIFTCPESYEKGFFEIGKTYSINITDQKQGDFEWTIPNESVLNK